MLELVTLYAVSAIGIVFFPINPEAASIFYASELGWSPVQIGVVCGLGQASVYALLFLGGKKLLEHCNFLRLKVEETRQKYEDRLREGFVGVSVLTAFVGFPPMGPMAILAPGFGASLRVLIPMTLVLRVCRFSLIAAAGEKVLLWFTA